MTLANDFLTEDQSLEDDYPSAFGITFTPMVSGIALAVIGLVGAGYIFMNMVAPAQKKYQEASTKQQETQAQLSQIQSGDLIQQLDALNADLQAKKALKSRVVAMFTHEKDLETLLLDLNSYIAANQGELIQYNHDAQVSVINDSSLGNGVQGKLKKKGISLQIEGTFSQTQSILRDIERLQPLLMVQNYSSSVGEKPTAILTSNNTKIVPQEKAMLKTQLKLNAILPFSQQELEQARKLEEQQAKESKKPE